MSRYFQIILLAAATLIGISLSSAGESAQASEPAPATSAFASWNGPDLPAPVTQGESWPWMVILEDAPTAGAARGQVDRHDNGRLNAQGARTRAYANQLRAKQKNLVKAAGRQLGRSINQRASGKHFVHALNAVVLDLDLAEARKLQKLEGVSTMEPLRFQDISSDDGPKLIGAPWLWQAGVDGPGNGPLAPWDDPDNNESAWPADQPYPLPAPGAHSNRGEGMVIGIIDTGLNFDNPSFGELDQYGHKNPNTLGNGRYIGLCADPGDSVWEPRCNSKVIGAYDLIAPIWDEILQTFPRAADGPGPEDEGGHGSHTAATAAGNSLLYPVPAGETIEISGVAPNANIVVFNACFSPFGTGGGSCPSFSTAAAVEQAIADGVVDVINYSISGGDEPWSNAVSLAFLNATEAGISVVASAGNDGPGGSTVDHNEPWVTTVAASTHRRSHWGHPATIDIAGETIGHTVALTGHILDADLQAEVSFDSSDPEHCGFAPSSDKYAGQAVIVLRSDSTGCSVRSQVFLTLRQGAEAVLIASDAEGEYIPVVGSTNGPAAVLTPDLATTVFAALDEGTPVSIEFSAERVSVPRQPDQIAEFSSRGPSTVSGLLKPDIAAPGVAILSAYANTADAFGADAYGLLSGTSMAAPHVAGAAALLRQSHPDWTPSEVKSALMMTAQSSMTLMPGGLIPASQYHQGAGRADLPRAASAGLVMDETAENFRNADPGINANAEHLNVPSLAASSCVGTCTFVREFRSTARMPITWEAELSGELVGSVSPAVFTVRAGRVQSLEISLDVNDAAHNQREVGSLILTPVNKQAGKAGYGPLTLPLSTFVDPVKLEVSVPATGLHATVPSGGSETLEIEISNLGNAGLTWETAEGLLPMPVVDQRPDFSFVVNSTTFPDAADLSKDRYGIYTADDFEFSQTTTVRELTSFGFLNWGFNSPYDGPLSDVVDFVAFEIYADNGGEPNSYPPPPGETAEEPLWRYTAAPGTGGVSNSAVNVSLDLDAAGQTLELPPGKYWLSVHMRPSNTRGSWRQFVNEEIHGDDSKVLFNHEFIARVNGQPLQQWIAISSVLENKTSLAMAVTADTQCGASWAEVDPAALTMGADETVAVAVTLSAADLPAQDADSGPHQSTLCLLSNDPAQPVVLIPMSLKVTQ